MIYYTYNKFGQYTGSVDVTNTDILPSRSTTISPGDLPYPMFDMKKNRWYSFPPVVVQPSPVDVIKVYENALQDAMDALAGSWGYGCPPGAPGSIGYAIGTYLTSTNAQWKADATALQEWLESVWLWGQQQQAEILADPSKLPATPEEFVAQMPAAPVKPVIS